jgi:hypothetical protein
MLPRRRCPFCRRWFHPHPRLRQRQKTCGRTDCRRKQKRKSDQQWRNEHPDYFRDAYALQKEKYGTRSDYKRRYRQQHPDYVQRNAAFVRKCRQQLILFEAKAPGNRGTGPTAAEREPLGIAALEA